MGLHVKYNQQTLYSSFFVLYQIKSVLFQLFLIDIFLNDTQKISDCWLMHKKGFRWKIRLSTYKGRSFMKNKNILLKLKLFRSQNLQCPVLKTFRPGFNTNSFLFTGWLGKRATIIHSAVIEMKLLTSSLELHSHHLVPCSPKVDNQHTFLYSITFRRNWSNNQVWF